MEEYFELRLTGGVFFTILQAAVKKHTKMQKDAYKGFIGYSQAELLKALLNVITPGECEYEPTTLKSMATHFKQCDNVPCIPTPISHDAKIFDQNVRKGDPSTLAAMNNLVEHFIDVKNRGVWLIKALVELLSQDENIHDDCPFYISPDGKAIKKDDIFETSDFCITWVLLGFFHYCILNAENNTEGKKTYKYLCPDGKNLSANIGMDNSFYVNLIPFKLEKDLHDNETSNKAKKNTPSIESAYFKPYFDAIHEDTHCINTILRSEAYLFEDFYIPMGLSKIHYFESQNTPDQGLVIDKPDIEQLKKYSRCLMIQASGGMGKSMLMKHLIYDGIAKSASSGKIPVYIELKNYTQPDDDIIDFFVEEMSRYMSELDQILFYRVLDESRFVFILDGLDEMNSSCRGDFLKRLFTFLSKHRDTQVVLSSRPYSYDIPLNMFKVLNISPLTLEQAEELLNKIEYYPDTPELKEDFITSLKDHLYKEYMTFAKNPLLLMSMMITFCENGRMPEIKSDFYEKVFDDLATRHDYKKDGYRRRLESGLSYGRLKDYFAAFCSRTYLRGELVFSHSNLIDDFKEFLKIANKPSESDIDPELLLEDYVSGVCMLYKEGERYYFVHRSFQEYFCARYLLKQRPRNWPLFVKQAENGPFRYDTVLSFLYEKRPADVEEHLFLPYLEQLISTCENANGYWTYLATMYPVLHYEVFDDEEFGKGRTISYFSDPTFLFLSFLFTIYPIQGKHGIPYLNQYEEYIESEYTRIEINGELAFTTMDQAKFFYEEQDRLMEFYDNPPRVIGYHVAIPTNEVYEMRNELPELIAEFEADDFKPKMEYESLMRIRNYLQEKQDSKIEDIIEII